MPISHDVRWRSGLVYTLKPRQPACIGKVNRNVSFCCMFVKVNVALQLISDVRRGGHDNFVLLGQRFSNFFQVGTTFISQNVIRTTLLLSALKANCLRFSTKECDTQFTFIFSVFFRLMFNLRWPQGQNQRTTCGPRTTVWKTLF
jgi:hypothetical protein